MRGVREVFCEKERMIPYDLYRLLQCPTCGSRDLLVTDAGVQCAGCRNDYPRHDGYLDLMPRAVDFDYVSKYVTEEEQLAEELDYRDLAPPLLAAGVRNRALVRLLDLRPGDIVLDNGCGTAKFAAWNAAKVGLMVGSDPATLFADAAVEQVALAKADSRKLPFADGSFDKGFSVDVLEHFPRDVIDGYLAEMARVLRPGGRLVVLEFSRVWAPLARAYDAYSFQVLPWLGARVAGNADAYRYLAESIRMHPDQATLARMMEEAGLAAVEVFNLMAGVVAVHRGIKF
jgi:ubiquinone/menaquinone biosynthesis methyltransferase